MFEGGEPSKGEIAAHAQVSESPEDLGSASSVAAAVQGHAADAPSKAGRCALGVAVVALGAVLTASWFGAFDLRPQDPPDAPPGGGDSVPDAVVAQLVRRVDPWFHGFRFDRARRELEQVLALPLSPESRAPLAERLRRLERQGALLDALVAAPPAALEGLNIGLPTHAGFGRVVRIDHQGVALIVDLARATPREPQETTRRIVDADWSTVDAWSCWLLLSRAASTYDHWRDLAGLLEELGCPEVAEHAWIQALKRHPDRHAEISAEVARLRHEPEGAYTLVADQLVRVENLPMIERGLVRWRQEWVSPADLVQLAKRKVLRDGRWVPLSDEELRARGDVRDAELGWLSSAEMAARLAQWEHGWSRQTAVWRIRTNVGEETLARVEGALERLTPSLRRRFGPLVSGAAPLGVLAFREAESFRNYAARAGIGLEAWIRDGGLIAGREAGCVVGADGAGIPPVLSMAARLYYRHSGAAAGGTPPRWVEDGLAAEVGAWGTYADGTVAPTSPSWFGELERWSAASDSIAVDSAGSGGDPLSRIRLEARTWREWDGALREEPPRPWRGPDARLAEWTRARDRARGGGSEVGAEDAAAEAKGMR